VIVYIQDSRARYHCHSSWDSLRRATCGREVAENRRLRVIQYHLLSTNNVVTRSPVGILALPAKYIYTCKAGLTLSNKISCDPASVCMCCST
jgi:hypothetical protein